MGTGSVYDARKLREIMAKRYLGMGMSEEAANQRAMDNLRDSERQGICKLDGNRFILTRGGKDAFKAFKVERN